MKVWVGGKRRICPEAQRHGTKVSAVARAILCSRSEDGDGDGHGDGDIEGQGGH